MILHSIASQMEVFPPTPDDPVNEYRPLRYGCVEGTRQDGRFVVSRLISTDPHQYLDPHYAPGTQSKIL